MTGAPGGDTRSVAIVTLGCGRNEVDSDQLAGLLTASGMQVVPDAEGADVVLVNTCTFIAPAKQESVDTVLAACDLKEAGTSAVLVVGCMAQRYPDELAEAIPEADAIVGFDAYASLPALIDDILAARPHERIVGIAAGSPAPTPRLTLPVVATSTPATVPHPAPAQTSDAAPWLAAVPESDQPASPSSQDGLDRVPATGPRFPVRRFDGAPWAYLKIASGCDRLCTFCAIPSFRGRFRSRPIDELVAEAAWLADQGARELVLVSENTTSYGKDLPGWSGRPGGRELQRTLLTELAGVDGIERLRLMYLQPAELQPALIETMASIDKVAPYFDLSLQHAAAPVLTRMARSGSPERFLALIEHIRALAPDAVFRSNFILGFPGETDDDVAALADFLQRARLDWVGLFTFSQEDGTPSAELPDQIPDEVAQERRLEISELQEVVADEAARAFVGRTLDVIVQERVTDGGEDVALAGRSYREAPDTDGEIQLIDATGAIADAAVGATVRARVVDAVGVDLVAEVLA